MYCGSAERLFCGSLGTCKISERRYIQQRHGWILRNGYGLLLLCFSLVRHINGADKLTPIAVSLSSQDFHETLQLQAYKKEVVFGTEGGF